MRKEIEMVIMPEDANTLLAFKKYRDKFVTLLEAGVFDLEEGKAEINVHNGQVQTIHIHRVTYKRESGKM